MADAVALLLALLTPGELAEYCNLPAVEFCEQQYDLGGKVLADLVKAWDRASGYRRVEIGAAYDEAATLRRWWGNAWDAQTAVLMGDHAGTVPDWQERRARREWCRRFVGEANWVRQQWPLPVPRWRACPK